MALMVYLMIIIINLMIGIKNGFSPINKMKNKYYFIIILSFIGLFLLIAGYRNYSGLSNDLSNAEYEFLMISQGSPSVYEIGYAGTMKLCSILGGDFYTWRSISTFVALLLIFYSTIRWSKNPHFFIGLFTIYLVIVSAERFRNFLALSIFQIGLSILYYSNFSNKNKKILYVIFVIIASQFHSIFLFNLILLISFKNMDKNKLKIIISFIILFCIIIFLNGNSIPGLSVVISLLKLDGSHWMNYLSQKTNLGFIYPMFLHGINVYVAYKSYKLSNNNIKQEHVFEANAVMMVYFPLYMLQLTMSRMSSNLIPILLFSVGDVLFEKRYVRKKLALGVLCVVTMILWLYINLVKITLPEAVLYPFFSDNVFL